MLCWRTCCANASTKKPKQTNAVVAVTKTRTDSRVTRPTAHAHVHVCTCILYSACTMHPFNFCNNDPPLPHTTRRPSSAHKNGTRARAPVGTGVPVRLWCGEREKRSEKYRTSFLLVWEEGHCYAVREGVLIWARYITQIYERPQNQLLPIVHLRLPYRETRELALVNAFGVTRRRLIFVHMQNTKITASCPSEMLSSACKVIHCLWSIEK